MKTKMTNGLEVRGEGKVPVVEEERRLTDRKRNGENEAVCATMV